MQNNAKTENKLASLIVDEDLDAELLSSILGRFLRIKSPEGNIILLPDFSKLKYKDAVLLVLLGLKAANTAGLRSGETTGPKEVSQITGIKLSTVKNILRDLEEGDRLVSSKKGKYSVPNFLLHMIKERFENLDLEKTLKQKTGKQRQGKPQDFKRLEGLLAVSPGESFAEHYDFLIQKGKYLDKCLVVLSVLHDKFGVDALSSGEITHILRNYLRVPGVHQPNITTALGSRDALRYIFKDPIDGGKYGYRLNTKGKERVKELNQPPQ